MSKAAAWLVVLWLGACGMDWREAQPSTAAAACALPLRPSAPITYVETSVGCGELPGGSVFPPADYHVVAAAVDAASCQSYTIAVRPGDRSTWSLYAWRVGDHYEGAVDLEGAGHCDYTFSDAPAR